MHRNVIIAIAVGAGLAFVVWYIMKRKDRFVSTSYGTTCTEVCSVAHPTATATCVQNVNDPECKSYHACINECRQDQENLIRDENSSDLDLGEWGGPYGKLLS
jgi:hypothetical protein